MKFERLTHVPSMNPRFRFETAGGVYHVTNRGVDHRDIVTDHEERRKWLYCLGDAAARYGWRVYAYALTNHFHVFLQTPEPNLSAGMQEFEGRYAAFFNRRQDRSGHLFEDRFHAILVEQDSHAWELSRYLHLNAVRARLVKHPDAYPWSSFPAYMNSRLAPAWLDWQTVLGHLGRTESAARLAYRRFVEAGIQSPPENPFDRVVADFFLGSDEVKSPCKASTG
jgi:REP element-mobilizing transposase RayT